ncbi:MAG: hypothetical protein V3U76_13570 [Granulosicoccus sp.]
MRHCHNGKQLQTNFYVPEYFSPPYQFLANPGFSVLLLLSMPTYSEYGVLPDLNEQSHEQALPTRDQINLLLPDIQPAIAIYPPNKMYKLKTPLNGGWRLSYDLLLTEDGHTRTIFDERGHAHIFHSNASDVSEQEPSAGEYVSENTISGSLSRSAGRHYWSRPDGSVIEFYGSLPFKWKKQDGSILTLNYAAGHLVSVSSDSGHILTFNYRNKKLENATLPDGTQLQFRLDGNNEMEISSFPLQKETPPPDTFQPIESHNEQYIQSSKCQDPEVNTVCDVANHPPPDGFTSAVTASETIRIDARPQSCNSYFTDFSDIDRGVLIERHLANTDNFASMEATVRSFPIVDFIAANEIYIEHSRDLTNDTYSRANDNPLYDSLMRDGTEIVNVFLNPLQDAGALSTNELGESTTIRYDQFDTVVLNLVIQFNIASPDQLAQIQQARHELLAQYGIYLQVIEIP